MDDFWLAARLLLMLGVANSAPIAAKRLLGSRWCWPLDAGLILPDGRPLLGPSKTVRGVLVAVAACMLCAPVLGFPITAGALTGACSHGGPAVPAPG